MTVLRHFLFQIVSTILSECCILTARKERSSDCGAQQTHNSDVHFKLSCHDAARSPSAIDRPIGWPKIVSDFRIIIKSDKTTNEARFLIKCDCKRKHNITHLY